MGFYDGRTPEVSDHERSVRSTRSRRPAVSPELQASAKRERLAEALRVAPVSLGVFAYFLLPEAFVAFSNRPFVQLSDYFGLAIVVGLVGGVVLFLKRPPRIVALVWFSALEGLLAVSAFAGPLPNGDGISVWRFVALGFVTAVTAGIAALSPTGWRPPPIRWED